VDKQDTHTVPPPVCITPPVIPSVIHRKGGSESRSAPKKAEIRKFSTFPQQSTPFREYFDASYSRLSTLWKGVDKLWTKGGVTNSGGDGLRKSGVIQTLCPGYPRVIHNAVDSLTGEPRPGCASGNRAFLPSTVASNLST